MKKGLEWSCNITKSKPTKKQSPRTRQRFALVARVTADVRHEVRDELVTAPQLGIDIRPGLADEGARGDEIVERDERRGDEQQDDEGQAGEERFVHAADPYSAKTARGIRS